MPLAEVLDRADLLIVATPHDCYRGLTCRQPVLDVTGTIKPTREGRAGGSAGGVSPQVAGTAERPT